jgi:RHH-type transcriptional regulator, rel operon repressor / antitoxin RelB
MIQTAVVNLRVKPMTKKRLEDLAHATRRTKSFIAEEALEAYLDVNEWQIKGIEAAVQEADSSNAEWTDHEDVKAKWEAKRAQMAVTPTLDEMIASFDPARHGGEVMVTKPLNVHLIR